MLNAYEELRETQLEFLDKWNQKFVIPARKEVKLMGNGIIFKDIKLRR